jgi:hypothetical protein
MHVPYSHWFFDLSRPGCLGSTEIQILPSTLIWLLKVWVKSYSWLSLMLAHLLLTKCQKEKIDDDVILPQCVFSLPKNYDSVSPWMPLLFSNSYILQLFFLAFVVLCGKIGLILFTLHIQMIINIVYNST